MAKRKTGKNSLVGNINRRKSSGTSRNKKNSTITPRAYEQMQEGWPGKGEKGERHRTKQP